jgi:peroxiredoxin
MALALLLARLLLAVVFAVAGLAKLADRAGSQQALVDFGLPAFLAKPFGILLPLAELVVAIALVPTVSAWWAALGALGLLLLFVAGIGYNLAQGRTPDCHCFGQLHSAPVGRSTLLRNLVLAAVAGFIVWQGQQNAGASAVSWLGALPLAERLALFIGVIVVVLLAGEGWMLLKMLGQQGRVLLRIEAIEAQLAAHGMAPLPASAAASVPGLPVGTPAPTFALATLTGETITLSMLHALGKPIVLLFSDPGCGPCTALLPQVARWQRDLASKLVVTLISRGDPETNRAKATEYGITHVLLQQDREVAEAYQAYGTPSAVLLRRDGTIGSPVAQGADAIRELISRAITLPVLNTLAMAAPLNGNGQEGAALLSQPAIPKVGEPAPEFTLPDLDGKNIVLADFRGSPTLVLFWNPACGFCQSMLKDLKAWEAQRRPGALQLLVVSTGSLEANKAMDLRSPVLLDQDFKVGGKFGADGTPMALLVDAEGKIASELAEGAPNILRLMRARHGWLKVART